MTRSSRTQPDGRQMQLQPLTETGAHQIEHWFDHPEVERRLGGRFWIHRELRMISRHSPTVFRGAVVLRAHGWIGLDHRGKPVAFICGDVYDRWVRYHGEGCKGPVLSDTDPRVAMGLAYVVDPDRWRHGYGRSALQAVLNHPDASDAHTFFCGIDVDNRASRTCAESAGFTLADLEPDHEGMLYYRRTRSI
ncbi:GNAT family N-acetyltransferase [Streptomyces sp. 039-1]|uniref:GNAT family N-acetyltransferase n=1 Tax=Streptomyces sp. 039-1 TaxID=2789263 RepID=UPI0039F5A37D